MFMNHIAKMRMTERRKGIWREMKILSWGSLMSNELTLDGLLEEILCPKHTLKVFKRYMTIF